MPPKASEWIRVCRRANLPDAARLEPVVVVERGRQIGRRGIGRVDRQDDGKGSDEDPNPIVGAVLRGLDHRFGAFQRCVEADQLILTATLPPVADGMRPGRCAQPDADHLSNADLGVGLGVAVAEARVVAARLRSDHADARW
jgi:hypothetical protein